MDQAKSMIFRIINHQVNTHILEKEYREIKFR